MANIGVNKLEGTLADKILMMLTFAVMSVGYYWGTPDGYLLGRFLFISILAFGAITLTFRRVTTLNINLIDVLVLLYLAYQYLSMLWAPLPSAGIAAAQTTFLFAVFYFYFRSMGRALVDKEVFVLIHLMGLISLIFAAAHIIYVATQFGLEGDNIYKIPTPNGHKNFFSSFAFMLIGLQLYGMSRFPVKWWQIAIVSILILEIFLLRSRTSFIALVLFGLILAVVSLRGKVQASSHMVSRKVVIGTMVFFACAIALMYSTSSSQDIQKFLPSNFLKTPSGQERAFVWYKTTLQLKDTWLKGTGIGNWKLQFPSLNIEGAYRLQTMDTVFTRVHNDFLEVFAELGILGFLFFVAIFLFAILKLMASKEKTSRLERHVLVGIILGYMVISFFEFPKERIEHNLMLAFSLAIIGTYGDAGWTEKFQTFFRINVLKNGIFGFAVLGLLFNLMYSRQWIRSSGEMIKVVQYQQNSDWVNVARSANQAYHPLFQIDHTATPVKWYEGLGLYHQQKFSEAEKAFAMAFQQAPYHFRLCNDYAGCMVNLGKFQEAIPLYERALFINPKHEEARFSFAFVLAKLGRFDEAVFQVNQTKNDLNKKSVFLEEIARLRANNSFKKNNE